MILVRVFCDLGLVEKFDPRPYTRDWFLHRDEERYQGHLLAHTHRVETPEAGDIMLFKIGRCYAHGGIVVETAPLTIVHAFAPARSVVEDQIRRCPDLAEKPHKFFSYWGESGRRQSPTGSRENARSHFAMSTATKTENEAQMSTDCRPPIADCR